MDDATRPVITWSATSVDGLVRLGYPLHFVTLGEQDALAEGGYVVLVDKADPLRARPQRRLH